MHPRCHTSVNVTVSRHPIRSSLEQPIYQLSTIHGRAVTPLKLELSFKGQPVFVVSDLLPFDLHPTPTETPYPHPINYMAPTDRGLAPLKRNKHNDICIINVRDRSPSPSATSSADSTNSDTSSIASMVQDGLAKPSGSKELPTLLLYDEMGLQLYDDITTKAKEYYLFGAEEEILRLHSDAIIKAMHGSDENCARSDEVVLELGAGALRKTSHLLLGFSRLIDKPSESSPITYYALDLEENELERTLGEIAMSEVGEHLAGKVETKGICATYDEGLRFFGRDRNNTVASPSSGEASPVSPTLTESTTSDVSGLRDPGDSPLHILFLGSSLGNFSREGGEDFLRSLPLRPGSGDTLLLGLDHDNGKVAVEQAYNDEQGYTARFIMNGLRAAGRALGDEQMFDESKWEYVNRYNEKTRHHEAFFKSKCDQSVQDPKGDQVHTFLRDELLKIEESYKYSEEDVYSLFSSANLRPIQRWTDKASQYSLWLLERPQFTFPSPRSRLACNSSGELVPKKSLASSPFSVPSLQEWENLWTAWDFVTLKMIPPAMLYQKPIDLRHICLFYVGHIPTFLDIHLSRLLQEHHTEPEKYKVIFERGIDPSVDDPTICHAHSEIPTCDEDWPTLESLLDFRSRVRSRLQKLYGDIETGERTLDRETARVLFMTLEHEALHLETLLYMLLQRAGNGTIPPRGFTKPSWASLCDNWKSAPKPSSPTVTMGPASVSLGHDDDETKDQDASAQQEISQHEFGWDLENPARMAQVGEFRIEWRPVTNGEFLDFSRNAGYGKVSYPASWVEVGGETKVRTLYGPVPMKVAQDWPVMTSYNNLSAYAVVKGGRLPTEAELRLFYDKFEAGFEGGSNYGFRNWHPIPATTGGPKNDGKGGNGGVWEWTSTVLDAVEGFKPSALYPGYSADFFDGVHHIVIGGSYVTVPRLAERRSFRNWFQRNYEYAWVGGRVVYDV